jgi:hypothetical protein
MDATTQAMSFDEALAESREVANEPHLLLGNGFSIACRPDRFSYGALLDEATFDSAHGDVRAVFEMIGTTDFERVIEVLKITAALAEKYGSEPEICERLRNDGRVVRETLANTLAARHPDLPFDVEEAEYAAARRFLSNFRKIYTLNYDMLLYWAVMQDVEPPVPTNDGFTTAEDPDADYVVWEAYLDFRLQRLFFLHGGLHLYDTGSEISKITWSRTGVPLVDQIRQALAESRYPLIVTEGDTRDKEGKILHNAYLNHAIRSFAMIEKVLFVYGHSLAESDEHILRRIEEGKLERVYVSIYGDPSSAQNRGIIGRAQQMAAARVGPRAKSLAIRFYDAASAHVWG